MNILNIKKEKCKKDAEKDKADRLAFHMKHYREMTGKAIKEKYTSADFEEAGIYSEGTAPTAKKVTVTRTTYKIKPDPFKDYVTYIYSSSDPQLTSNFGSQYTKIDLKDRMTIIDTGITP